MKARERRVRREAARTAPCPQCRRPHLSHVGGDDVSCRKCGYYGAGGDGFAEECERVRARKTWITSRNTARHEAKSSAAVNSLLGLEN